MDEDKTKAEEIAEIKRRIEYLKNTDQLSDSQKVSIVQRALEIIEEGKNRN
jgi:lipopolysaccharide biosynthesis protein